MAADFQYFVLEDTGGWPRAYFRFDPDAQPGNQIRISDDGLWKASGYATVDKLLATPAGPVTEINVEDMHCHLCMLVAGTVTRIVVREWPDAIAVVPRPEPVVDGHILVIPRKHVRGPLDDPAITGTVRMRAAELQRDLPLMSSNYVDSDGRDATQSEPHLHGHIVPRSDGDGLLLPWSTQPSHLRRLMDSATQLQRERDDARFALNRIRNGGPDRSVPRLSLRESDEDVLAERTADAASGQSEVEPT